jgi:hypothetical protein
MAVSFEKIRKSALALDGVVETSSYGTPAFKVNGKLFARLHQDGKTFIVHMNFDQREDLIAMDPDTFFITEHYKNYEWVLVNMATVSATAMTRLLANSHQARSVKKNKLTARKSRAEK